MKNYHKKLYICINISIAHRTNSFFLSLSIRTISPHYPPTATNKLVLYKKYQKGNTRKSLEKYKLKCIIIC